MAISRLKTWIDGEVLTHTDLNAEFNNILNNALSLISPATGDLDLGGNDVLSARNYYPDPGGRLCLTSATPVHTSDAADQTTLYYAIYNHDLVPLYDGTDWDVFRFTELSIAMAASANWAADSNFDVYIYNDGGTLRLVTGAAWTNDTTRSETLTKVNGRWTNTASMTGRYAAASTVTVAANKGLYVGTIRTTGTAGTTTMEFGGSAANGDPIRFYVWNAYNRVRTAARNLDTTDSWNYGTSTWRNKNASTSNIADYVVGLNEDAVHFGSHMRGLATSSIMSGRLGLGPDTTGGTTPTHAAQFDVPTTAGVTANVRGVYEGYPGLGYHYFQAQEWGVGAGTLTWYGDNAGVINSDIQLVVQA